MQVASRISAMASSGAPAEPYWGLYFEAEQANCVVNMNKYAATNTVSLECSRDGATWTDFDGNSNTGSTPVTLANIGDRVYFRTKGSTVGKNLSTGDMKYRYFTLSKKAGAGGNIMSLVRGDIQTTTIPATYYFYALFDSCANLTTPPELPATTLTDNCYESMFYDCAGLTSAPELPATTLKSGCYRYMFSGCTSLTAAPDLPATTLKESCYNYMFYGCTVLSSIKAYFTKWVGIYAGDATYNWVSGVASLGTFYCSSVIYNNGQPKRGTSYVPTNWTATLIS